MIRRYDVIVIGGGPFGLTAARALASAGRNVVVVEASAFGGRPLFLEWIEGYPNAGERIEGPTLASRLVDEAEGAGARLESGRVVAVELYSECQACVLDDGSVLTADAVIIAVGRADKKLNIEGETEFVGRGVIQCALCDGGLYRNKPVVVCGGGNAGVAEALHLAHFGARVTLLEQGPRLTCTPELAQRVMSNPQVAVLTGATVTRLEGDQLLRSVSGRALDMAEPIVIPADGFLARVGYSVELPEFSEKVDRDVQGRPRVTEGGAGSKSGLYCGGDASAVAEGTTVAAIKQGEAVARALLAHSRVDH